MTLGRKEPITAHFGPHHLALERLAAQALTDEDFVAAFSYADRRCRISPPASAHCFILRAEANWRLARHEAALTDVSEALSIAPNDLGANRRLLGWAKDDRQKSAAANLVRHDRNAASLRTAIRVLREHGERQWAAVSVYDDCIVGWAAWIGNSTVEACISDQNAEITSKLEPDPFHSLAGASLNATTFRLRRPASDQPQQLAIFCDEDCFLSRRLPPSLVSPLRLLPALSPETNPTTVIVPVYRDVAATIQCFESLFRARDWTRTNLEASAGGLPFRILAIDDATPEAELRTYLSELATKGRIELMTNDTNLGFVGSINRALDQTKQGDIVLLNADTLVPPGFVERLAASAHSAPDIGTATPFSNNADLFSFPRVGADNPLPSYEDVVDMDMTAATANANVIRDVPSGIGFCLYITRQCLDTVGNLSERFERGYLEDVDFCLRARRSGFRNVCAASVFVGHHGSKSFREEKRGLVVRNLGVLEQGFPSYRKECIAFETADPLRRERAAIEAALPCAAPSVLLVFGSPNTLPLAKLRARMLAKEARRSLIASPDGRGIRICATDGGAPQSVKVTLDPDGAASTVADQLRHLNLSHIEVLDPAFSSKLLEAARTLNLAVDVWLTTAFPYETLASLDPIRRLLAPTEAAWAFSRPRLPGRKIGLSNWPVETLALPGREASGDRTLAVVPAGPSPAAWRTLWALAQRIQRLKRPIGLLIAGSTLDDNRLMSRPGVFVTGQISLEELPKVLGVYNPSWLLTDFENPFFGHPVMEATRRAGLPVAYRDWSGGAPAARKRDLAIRMAADVSTVADDIVRWTSRAPR
jgi:GT2 family glycosyltransferase